MIEGFAQIDGYRHSDGLAALGARIAALLGPASERWRISEVVRLGGSVFRLHLACATREHRVVIKRLRSGRASRNELAARQWLPSIGLGDGGPPLLDSCPADSGHVWHVYDDLGDCALSENVPDRRRVRVALELVAAVHSRFSASPLLADCRAHGTSYGADYFRSNMGDAIRILGEIASRDDLGVELRAAVERLTARLGDIEHERDARAEQLTRLGGPETLLHGDLWPKNVLAICTPTSERAVLIDWDRAGVGPPIYDLSTFLSRFPRRDRAWILELYREAIAPHWVLPDASTLNELFGTAQFARLANCVVWPALQMLQGDTEWAPEEICEVDEWFESMEPHLLDGDEPPLRSMREAR